MQVNESMKPAEPTHFLRNLSAIWRHIRFAGLG